MDIHDATERYFDRIHRAALVLTGSPWDADDLAQETFLQFSRNPEAFRGDSNPYTWLYGILLNIERHRRRRLGTWRQKFQMLCQDLVGQTGSVPAAETAIEVAEWKHGLWAKVAQLPDAQRQALVLRFSESLPYEEIATVMNCPVGTAKSRVHHGLIALRRLIDVNSELATGLPPFPNEDLAHAIT